MGLSGVGLLVLGFFKNLFLPYPLINITKEEKAFLNNYLVILRKCIFELFIFGFVFVYSIVVTSINLETQSITNSFPFISNLFLPNALIITLDIVAIITWVFFIVMKYSKKLKYFVYGVIKRRVTGKKMIGKREPLYFWLILGLLTNYIITLSANFGYFINFIFALLNIEFKLAQSLSINVLFKLTLLPYRVFILIIVLFILSYFMYRLALNILITQFGSLTHTRILTTITLTNGVVLHNKYILRPSVDGNILIGDKPTITEDCNKIMLPKHNILFIEFKTIYISYDKNPNESYNSKRILLPPDFK